MPIRCGWVSVETLANKSPLVLVADLSWCNLDVVFQARGSSREKRLRQQYTYSIHRLVDRVGEAPGWLMVYICVCSKVHKGQHHQGGLEE